MPLTPFQRQICRLLAENRIRSGESYVAGGAALNELPGATRLSRDIDLFHDTAEALQATWDVDRQLLVARGYDVQPRRERSTFIEALVSQGSSSVLMQWAHDSAFRFFPLVEHPDFGLTLHPFDLATNKVLALVGRLEVRDWLDVIHCHTDIQPFGYLSWAACGKDAGFAPGFLLDEAARSSHYTAREIGSLDFVGERPDAVGVAQQWRRILSDARTLVQLLPPEQVGKCVMLGDGTLYRGDAGALDRDLSAGTVQFHEGRVRGAWPHFVSPPD